MSWNATVRVIDSIGRPIPDAPVQITVYRGETGSPVAGQTDEEGEAFLALDADEQAEAEVSVQDRVRVPRSPLRHLYSIIL